MKKSQTVLVSQEDLRVDLTLHNVSALLLEEFATCIVKPYFSGNLNAAIQDLLHKALAEQDFVLSHVTQIRRAKEE